MPMNYPISAMNNAIDLRLPPQRDPRVGGMPLGQGGPGRGGMVPSPGMPVPDGRGGGTNPQSQGPSPNANAYQHANANARFMRTAPDGSQYADNPPGQRPAQSFGRGNMGGQQDDPETAMRKRRYLSAMIGHLASQPPSGGFYAYGQGGSLQPVGMAPQEPSYSFPAAPLPAYEGGGGYYAPPDPYAGTGGYQAPYSFSAAPLPAGYADGGSYYGSRMPSSDPYAGAGAYDILSPF